jgi:hypothetical protein
VKVKGKFFSLHNVLWFVAGGFLLGPLLGFVKGLAGR